MTGLFLAVAGVFLGFQYPEARWAFWLAAGFTLFMTWERHPELMPHQLTPAQPSQVQVQYQ